MSTRQLNREDYTFLRFTWTLWTFLFCSYNKLILSYLTLYCLCSNISVPHEHSPWMNSTVIKSVLNERSVVRKMIKTFPFTMFTMRKVVLVNNICQSNCGCEFPVNMAKLVAGPFWNLRFVFCSHFRRELFRRNICTGYDIMPPEKDPPLRDAVGEGCWSQLVCRNGVFDCLRN